MGSRAYGLETPESDTDIRGFFIPPTEELWKLTSKVPEQIMNGGDDVCHWEVGKFLRLSLNANPSCLECLFSNKIVQQDRWGIELRRIRKAFISQRIIQSFGGYARQQMYRFKQGLKAGKKPVWKQAMHMMRLTINCADILTSGTVKVNVRERRTQLLCIRNGGYKIDTVMSWYAEEEARVQDAIKITTIPKLPDFDTVELYLKRVRLFNLQEDSYNALSNSTGFLDEHTSYVHNFYPTR